MRRRVFNGKNIFLSIIVSSIIIFAFYVVFFNLSIEKNKKESLKYINKLIIYPEGTYDISSAKKAVDKLSVVKPKIFKKMVDENIKIKLINTNLKENKDIYSMLRGYSIAGNYKIEDITGVYFPNLFVAIRVDVETYGTEAHEIGHVADFMADSISKSEEFLRVKEMEKFKLLGENEYFDAPIEYFAEAFSYYYSGETTKNTLKEKAPNTYKFIKDFINNL